MKKILLLLISIIAGCGILAGCQKPENEVVAPYHVTRKELQGWHKGLPQPLKANKTWASKTKREPTAGSPIYVSNMTNLSNTHGFFSFQFNFSRYGYPLDNTNNAQTNLPRRPFYKKIGKNTYHVVSGLPTVKKDMEANNHHNALDYIPISNVDIKINKHNIQIWNHGAHPTKYDTYTVSKTSINQYVHTNLSNGRK